MTPLDPIGESFVPVPAEEVAVAYVDDEAALVDRATGTSHHLNATTTVIWRCLDGTVTLGELIDDLSEAYATDRGMVADGVLSVVHHLVAQGLVRDAAAPREPSPLVPANVDEPLSSDRSDPRYIAVPPSR